MELDLNLGFNGHKVLATPGFPRRVAAIKL